MRGDKFLCVEASDVDPSPEAPNNPGMAKEQTRRAFLEAIGKKVGRARLAKGWNRTTLARRAKVTVATIRACEEATKSTQPDKLKAIAVALGMSRQRLEADETKDPRVKGWHDEDYEIGRWYHEAPRQLKNRLWALYETGEAVAVAMLDPQFLPLLEGWTSLSQHQKSFVLSNYQYIRANPPDPGHTDENNREGVNDTASSQPIKRGPQR